jgi:hypothetical protein
MATATANSVDPVRALLEKVGGPEKLFDLDRELGEAWSACLTAVRNAMSLPGAPFGPGDRFPGDTWTAELQARAFAWCNADHDYRSALERLGAALARTLQQLLPGLPDAEDRAARAVAVLRQLGRVAGPAPAEAGGAGADGA